MASVSIGMPVYNGEKYVTQAVESLLSQTFTDFELIISDNCSTDATGSICSSFAKQDKRIRYYSNETNLGAAHNYNRVFELSSGKYFKWATHDDICLPTFLERCVEALNNAPSSVVLCYPKTTLISADNRIIEHYDDNVDLRSISPAQRLRGLLLRLRKCNCLCGLIRADALRRTRLVGAFIGSDHILLRELALLGQFREIPEYLFCRRMHAEQSPKANRAYRHRVRWFDPNIRRNHGSIGGRALLESVKSVMRIKLSGIEKLACLCVLSEYYWPVFRQWAKHRILHGLRVLWSSIGMSDG